MPDPVRIDTLTPLDPGPRTVVSLPMTAHDRRRVRRRLVVAAADEQWIVVRPRDRAEAARVGHLIGNLHRDLDVADDGTLIALHDAPLEARLAAAGYDAVVAHRPFRGRAPGEHAH